MAAKSIHLSTKRCFFEIILAPGQKHEGRRRSFLIISLRLEKISFLYVGLSDRIYRPFDCIIDRETAQEGRAGTEHGFTVSIFEN
jgi:hypothetical protein